VAGCITAEAQHQDCVSLCRFGAGGRYVDGAPAHVSGRGFVPRLSSGTLQLSIRCSSIHFLPRRSLPVRDRGDFGVAIAGSVFCAKAWPVKTWPEQTRKIIRTTDDLMSARGMRGLLDAHGPVPAGELASLNDHLGRRTPIVAIKLDSNRAIKRLRICRRRLMEKCNEEVAYE
jgi:hypothetical protein